MLPKGEMPFRLDRSLWSKGCSGIWNYRCPISAAFEFTARNWEWSNWLHPWVQCNLSHRLAHFTRALGGLVFIPPRQITLEDTVRNWKSISYWLPAPIFPPSVDGHPFLQFLKPVQDDVDFAGDFQSGFINRPKIAEPYLIQKYGNLKAPDLKILR